MRVNKKVVQELIAILWERCGGKGNGTPAFDPPFISSVCLHNIKRISLVEWMQIPAVLPAMKTSAIKGRHANYSTTVTVAKVISVA